MTAKRILPPLLLAVSSVTFAGSASADPLTGDTKLACEAILCLATGQPPGECTPALRKFFSIWSWRLSDTLRGRSNFLNLCPTASDDKTKSLVAAIAEGAGQCDAANLNVNLTYSCGSGVAGDLKARLFGGEVPFFMGAGDQPKRAAARRRPEGARQTGAQCQNGSSGSKSGMGPARS